MYSISSCPPSSNSFGSELCGSPSSGTGPAKCSSTTLIAPSEVIWSLELSIPTTSDASYSHAASGFPVIWTCLHSRFHQPSLRRTSAISLELVSHLVCFLMNSSLLFDPLQRHIGPTMLYSDIFQLVECSWMICFCISICNL